jgi:hypothetical protein
MADGLPRKSHGLNQQENPTRLQGLKLDPPPTMNFSG